MKKIAFAMLFFALPAFADDAGVAKAFRSLAAVLDAANRIETLRSANYLNEHFPLGLPADPWGNPYRVDFFDGGGYRIVAAGADGKFDEESWTKAGQFRDLDGDVVWANGKLLRSNRNWLVSQVVENSDSAAALQELEKDENLYMAMRAPGMQDVLMATLTTQEMLATSQRIANGADAPDVVRDAWGTPMRITTDGKNVRMVSAGADKKFDPMSWTRPVAGSADEDIVFENGQITRAHDTRAIVSGRSMAALALPQPADERIPQTHYQRIGEDVKAPVAVKRVEPPYPEAYRRLRISGIVILELAISEKGEIDDVRLLKSIAPQIDDAAMKTVRQWTFEPGTKDGKPTPTIFNLTINFKLN